MVQSNLDKCNTQRPIPTVPHGQVSHLPRWVIKVFLAIFFHQKIVYVKYVTLAAMGPEISVDFTLRRPYLREIPGYVGHGTDGRVVWSILTRGYVGHEAVSDLAMWNRGE